MFPGHDPDRDERVNRLIRLGWSLVGVFFLAAVLRSIMLVLGIAMWETPRTSYEIARMAAFCIACLNIGIWMWFPLEDLDILRRWIRTRKSQFPAHTSEFFAVMLTTLLLLMLIVGALLGALVFGIAGAIVYGWNVLGYAYVKRNILRVLDDCAAFLSTSSHAEAKIRLRALDVIRWHWSLEPRSLFRGWQQVRHFSLFLGFIVVAVIAWRYSQTLAYWVGFTVLAGGEVFLAIRRRLRDERLHPLEEERLEVSSQEHIPAAE